MARKPFIPIEDRPSGHHSPLGHEWTAGEYETATDAMGRLHQSSLHTNQDLVRKAPLGPCLEAARQLLGIVDGEIRAAPEDPWLRARYVQRLAALAAQINHLEMITWATTPTNVEWIVDKPKRAREKIVECCQTILAYEGQFPYPLPHPLRTPPDDINMSALIREALDKGLTVVVDILEYVEQRCGRRPLRSAVYHGKADRIKKAQKRSHILAKPHKPNPPAPKH